MTREEAIAIIRKEYLCVDRDCDIERSCGKCDLMMPSKEPILQAYKMAIQALEQEPCGDAVSREAVLSMQYRIDDSATLSTRDVVNVDDIEDLPPVNSQRWIPVSERLPEEAFGCFLTVEVDDRNGEPQRVLYPDFVGYDGETWNDASGTPIPFEDVAWMPLPEPYKDGGDTDG